MIHIEGTVPGDCGNELDEWAGENSAQSAYLVCFDHDPRADRTWFVAHFEDETDAMMFKIRWGIASE